MNNWRFTYGIYAAIFCYTWEDIYISKYITEIPILDKNPTQIWWGK